MSHEGAEAALLDQMKSLLFELLPDHILKMFDGAEFVEATDQSITVAFPHAQTARDYAKAQEIPLTAYLSYRRRRPFEFYVR